MQWHGDERIGLRQQFPPGPGNPAAHHRCKVETIGIFKGVHQRAGNLVEPHRGAGATVGGRVGNGLHGQDARAGVIHEWNAEPLAIGPRNEGKLRPACRAKPAALDRFAADGA